MKFPVQIADYNLELCEHCGASCKNARLASSRVKYRGYYTALRKNLCRAAGARLA